PVTYPAPGGRSCSQWVNEVTRRDAIRARVRRSDLFFLRHAARCGQAANRLHPLRAAVARGLPTAARHARAPSAFRTRAFALAVRGSLAHRSGGRSDAYGGLDADRRSRGRPGEGRVTESDGFVQGARK